MAPDYLGVLIYQHIFDGKIIEYSLETSISWAKPLHYGLEQPKIQTVVLGHLLVRLLIRPHRSLVCLLRTARFARALRCAH